MADRLVPFALLSGAATAILPAVYRLVRPDLDEAARIFAIYLGLLAIGLAWAAGASLQDRRRNSVTFLALLGVLSPLLAVAPVSGPLVMPAAGWLLGSALLSLAALLLLRRRWRR